MEATGPKPLAEKQAERSDNIELKVKDEKLDSDSAAAASGQLVPVDTIPSQSEPEKTSSRTADESSQKGNEVGQTSASETPAGQRSAPSRRIPLVVTISDIFAILFIAVMIMLSQVFPAPTSYIAGHIDAPRLILLLWTAVFSTIIQTYWFKDAKCRLDRADSRPKRFAQLDVLATVNPFLVYLPAVIMVSPLMRSSSPLLFGTALVVMIACFVIAVRWLSLLAMLPFQTGAVMGRASKADRRTAILAATIGSIASLCGILIPFHVLPITVDGLTDILAYLVTIGGSFIFLRSRVAAANPEISPASALKPSDKTLTGGEINLVYNHFVEVQKFLKQRTALRSPWKLGVLSLILLGAVFGNLHTNIGLWIAQFLANGGGAIVGSTAEAAASTNPLANVNSLANSGLVMFFGWFVATIASVCLYAFINAPKRIAADAEGIKLLYLSISGRKPIQLSWKRVRHIKVERPPGKASATSDKLVFENYDGAPLTLKLAGIASNTDREKLLAAIDRFAPEVSREAAIEETLRKPMEQNYTELWLQALAAPPKREKLKPLIEGAKLKEDHYQIKRELGVGGQGFAYLATDTRSGAQVVLKEFVLPVFVDVNARRQSLESFEKEAKLLTHLDHPQVVKLEGFFVEDHRAYLVLEHIDGENLRQIVMRDGPMDEERIKSLAIQMCNILAYLHSLTPPLVHRDFTPDNLILRKDGTLKLIDFNVAQQVEVATTGTVVGKQAYLPPEQFRGQAVPASDLYAMGATLYFLAGAKDPTPISVARPIKDGLPVSEHLDHLVSSMTQMEPTMRPATAQAVAEILQETGASETKPTAVEIDNGTA